MNNEIWHSRVDASQVEAALSEFGGQGMPAFLLYDLDLLAAKAAYLATAMPSVEHAIAIKACPFLFVLRHLVGLGLSLEAASYEEVHLALAAGCPPTRIVFDSPCKTVEELAFCLTNGITLNLDNRAEYDRVRELLAGAPPKGRIGLRVNTQVGEGSIAQTSVSGATSKFGLSLGHNREEIEAMFAEGSILSGLHAHVGSQGIRLEQLAESVARLAALVHEIVPAGVVQWLDIGGGLPWPYQDQPGLATPAGLFETIRTLIPPGMPLITEFGRAFFAGAAVYASRIEYVKSQGETAFATIHAGADLFMRPIYFPNIWTHRARLLPSRPRTSQTVKIVGPLCFAGDVLYADFPAGPPETGDWLIVEDVGAYTASMWSRHCSRGMPPILAVRDGCISLAKCGESPADLVRFWS